MDTKETPMKISFVLHDMNGNYDFFHIKRVDSDRYETFHARHDTPREEFKCCNDTYMKILNSYITYHKKFNRIACLSRKGLEQFISSKCYKMATQSIRSSHPYYTISCMTILNNWVAELKDAYVEGFDFNNLRYETANNERFVIQLTQFKKELDTLFLLLDNTYV